MTPALLFSALIIDPVTDTQHRLRWSAWRRCHQHRAKTCHYQRQDHNHEGHEVRLEYCRYSRIDGASGGGCNPR
jgi:hypothetical protein